MSGSYDKIDEISAIDKEDGVESLKKTAKANEPVEGRFQEFLDKPPQEIAEVANTVKQPTLEEVARTTEAEKSSLAMSAKDVIQQTKETTTQIEAIKSELATENLDIKKPISQLMKNKLTHIDDNLRVALAKAGVNESVQAEAVKSKQDLIPNPAAEFFDHLTHSQDQLNNLGNYLDALVNDSKELSPANMLAIQIKVNQIQQELEFFTNLLNKSLESTKALMNVQV